MTLTSGLGFFLLDNEPSRPLSDYHSYFYLFIVYLKIPYRCLYSLLYPVKTLTNDVLLQ